MYARTWLTVLPLPNGTWRKICTHRTFQLTHAHSSGIFSRYLGLLFTGTAIGPTLGGLVIRLSGSFISVFFIAGALHLLYALLIWFVIPESLSGPEMRGARARQREEEEAQMDVDEDAEMGEDEEGEGEWMDVDGEEAPRLKKAKANSGAIVAKGARHPKTNRQLAGMRDETVSGSM